jgi:TonB family protein
MTIYTSTSTYAANVPIAVELPGHDVGFRSLPFIVVNPSSEPFTAAEFTFAGSHVVGGCAQRFRMTDLIQRDLDIRAAYAELDPSRPPTQLLKVIGEGTTVTCKDPYASARFDGPPVAPDYPAMARALGQTGTTLVKVSLTDTGAVDAVAIYRSSGSDALDRSALNAAQRSHYKPQLFRCDPVAGAYLYTANFAAGN